MIVRSSEEEILRDLLGKLRELKRAQIPGGSRYAGARASQMLLRGMEIAEALVVREIAAWRKPCRDCGGSGSAPNGEDGCERCGGRGLDRAQRPQKEPKR